jgi:hypothetical protein
MSSTPPEYVANTGDAGTGRWLDRWARHGLQAYAGRDRDCRPALASPPCRLAHALCHGLRGATNPEVGGGGAHLWPFIAATGRLGFFSRPQVWRFR